MTNPHPPLHIAVACGGTGGHIFPGMATARELMNRGHRVTLWLTGRETERKALENWDGARVIIPAQGFSEGLSLKSLQTVRSLLAATVNCRRELKKTAPDVLLAMGAYASVGPCVAARTLGIPYILHESNVIPGRAVKLLSKSAHAVAMGFEEARIHLPKTRAVMVGIPLRQEFTQTPRAAKESYTPERPFRILVTGGSLGAHRLNQVAADTFAHLAKTGARLEIIHLTGDDDAGMVKSIYEQANVPAETIPFATNMAAYYNRVDFAICRAGSATCAELSYFGLPALLIPYPAATKAHQMANAHALEKRGMADVVAEDAFSEDWLEAYLQKMIASPERLQRLHDAAKTNGIPNAAIPLADMIEAAGKAQKA